MHAREIARAWLRINWTMVLVEALVSVSADREVERRSHSHEVCERVGLHLSPHLTPVCLLLELADSELGAHLFIRQDPQTLLATHYNGEPLTVEHGAPLRLRAPVKLGLKNVKSITRITYTRDEPRADWAERGYSRYDGL